MLSFGSHDVIQVIHINSNTKWNVVLTVYVDRCKYEIYITYNTMADAKETNDSFLYLHHQCDECREVVWKLKNKRMVSLGLIFKY